MEFVRNLADTLLDEAGRKATDAATIEFLRGKVERIEDALLKTRERLVKEFSHHVRYNEQKEETWKCMRELGKSDADIEEVKAQVRARAGPHAKVFSDNERAAEAARVEQEKEHEARHSQNCAELRGKAREECAHRFMDESATAKLAQDVSVRKRKANGERDADGSDDEGDEQPRKSAKTPEAAKKPEAASKMADAAEGRAAAAAAAAAAPSAAAPSAAAATSRAKGGKSATHRGPWPPAPTIKKPAAAAAAKKPAAAAAKKPAAAGAAGAVAKPPKGQRKARTAYQCWMGAPTTKQRFNEERQGAINALADGEELSARFKSQRDWYGQAWKQVGEEEHARFIRESEEEKKRWEAAGGTFPAADKAKKAKKAKEPPVIRDSEDSGSDRDEGEGHGAPDANKGSPAASGGGVIEVAGKEVDPDASADEAEEADKQGTPPPKVATTKGAEGAEADEGAEGGEADEDTKAMSDDDDEGDDDAGVDGEQDDDDDNDDDDDDDLSASK
jgi:hypothetical protein